MDWRTDGRTDMTKLTVAFRNFADWQWKRLQLLKISMYFQQEMFVYAFWGEPSSGPVLALCKVLRPQVASYLVRQHKSERPVKWRHTRRQRRTRTVEPLGDGGPKKSCFLGTFTKLQKSTISFVMSACPPVRPSVCAFVCMEQLGSQLTDFYEIWYLGVFRKSVDKIQVWLKSFKNNWYFIWKHMYIYNDIFLNYS
jgi:hypothetical protein